MSDLTPPRVKLQTTSIRDGLQWFLQSVRAFGKQPLALGSIFILTLVTFQFMVLIPLLGMLAWVVLSPAINVGLMTAMSQADSGQTPRPTVLLTGFRAGRAKSRSLLMLGAAYVVGVLLISSLTWMVFGDELAQIAKAAKGAESLTLDFSKLTTGFMVYLAFLAVVLMGLTWHAPALVFWYQTPPFKALIFSAMTCLHNLGAMLAYFGAWAAVLLPLAALEQSLGTPGNPLLAGLFFTIELLVGAVFVLSAFFTFKGSVVQTESTAQ